MAPVCSNCNGTDFVWANELKTGMTGGGSLSIRARGDLPLGTRICRTCGHADLFLRDISILHQPHLWRPGEFIPIIAKTATKPAPHHAAPPSAPPMAPTTPMPASAPPPAPPAAPPPPPPPPPEPSPPQVVEPPMEDRAISSDTVPDEPPAEKAKPARKRASRSKT